MIEINPKKKNTDTIIEPNIFSHNLEHTRSCMFHGLSAQLIRNRKFAGKPAACSGEAAEWYRIGNKHAYYTLDRFDSYTHHTKEWASGVLQRRNECNSQVIQNPVADEETGIGQNNLILIKNKKYEIRVVVKTNSDNVFKLKIRLTNSKHTENYAQAIICPPQHTWFKYVFDFVATSNDDNACFEIVTLDKGEMKIGAVSLLPTDNVMGLRSDVIENLKEIGPSVLRWPGGNFAGEYYWKDGLLDVDERGPSKSVREMETQPYTYGFDFHEMAIDDFISLCHIVGAQPYLTINLGRDSAQECAEFVEYCNGDLNTTWGAIRASRGHPDPYNVKYWSLGNELGLGHMEGPNSPAAYVKAISVYSKVMKAVDPDIVLFSSGAYNPEHDYSEWIRLLPQIRDDGIKFISFHNYVPRIFEGGADFVTENGLSKTYSTITEAPQHCLEAVELLRNRMNEVDCSNVAISYDEWNLYFTWYHDPGVIEGIYTALMLRQFCINCERLNIPMVMYFQPINEGAIVVHPEYSELSANGQVMALMKAHKGNILLDCETCDPDLLCLASFNENSSKTIITVINKSYYSSKEVKIPSYNHSSINGILYLGEDLNIGSRFITKEIAPALDCPPDAEIKSFSVPAHSILQIELQPN